MLAYWLMFATWMVGALQTQHERARTVRLAFFLAASTLTMLLIGLRFEVGGDWTPYLRMYDAIYFVSLPAAFSITDPGYAAFNWLSAQVNGGIVPVNLGCALIFTLGVARLAWRQPSPALAMLVATPYLIIVVAMGYTRQAAAIGLICLALTDLSERRLLRLFVLVGAAALFHKTAVLILPLALVPVFRRNPMLGVMGGVLFVALFTVLLRDSSDRLLTNYVQSNYDSQGAGIRVAMNVVAASLFFALRSRIDLPPFQKSFWTMASLLALLSVPALLFASASSGVDRLSLYLIPLQVVTYSRLPYLLRGSDRALPSVTIGVIAYSLLVQFVWLTYATNAPQWLPYQLVL